MAVVNKMVRPSTPEPVIAAAGLTPKEIFAMLRRHLLLVISLTILGLLIGCGTWYLLRKYYPKYTATTYIEVLPPIETDPTMFMPEQVSKEIRYSHRLSLATLIKQQSTLQELVSRDAIKETQWFKDRDRDIRKAIKYLERHLDVFPQRDGDYIEISMTCSDREEAALIVNEMVDLFLASQGAEKREDIAEKLARLEERRLDVQRDLDAAQRALDDVRNRFGITDLEERRDYRDPIVVKLDNLELEQNQLILQMRELQGIIKNLEELATGPITEQIEHRIERDPVIVLLVQQLALQESVLAGLLTKFGENHRLVRRVQDYIEEIRERKRLREAEIAEQLRQSNLQDAYDRMIE
ncbi:MAG: hypothetical protein DRP27_09990, partial [Thermotogae bacterium]